MLKKIELNKKYCSFQKSYVNITLLTKQQKSKIDRKSIWKCSKLFNTCFDIQEFMKNLNAIGEQKAEDQILMKTLFPKVFLRCFYEDSIYIL